ncbi:hypothetical protein K6U20_01415 [Vibrio fluvialis]|uniref:hypothetical protein n=1 Tax=Vibrio TaxID=662 RepID=UPI001558E43B|nr:MULTISPECIES: hypothetical protein [Vibrio]EKO3429607.1 hypothetical protein [Vibrio fluvialis]EKO3447934.1 hypothetical protein [Vibrio fluvialis]EKO3479811.1 hypothetical protein [Vibrio fluvialis]EKO3918183.1 hypothetical protein [Vibrio fluvialis]ELG2961705.1 hypothetical protein [Vibrio fluvialis]
MPNANTKKTDSKQQAEEIYEMAEGVASEAIENVKNTVQDTLEAGSETVKNKTEQAENMIKERPLLSVGCAFIAGWAISKLIK